MSHAEPLQEKYAVQEKLQEGTETVQEYAEKLAQIVETVEQKYGIEFHYAVPEGWVPPELPDDLLSTVQPDRLEPILDKPQVTSEALDWLKKFPLSAMIKFGWLERFGDDADQVVALFDFFGIISMAQWETKWVQSTVAFRKTKVFESDPESLSVWLCQGEHQARRITCQTYVADKFRQTLSAIRALTLEPPKVFQDQLVQLSADVGVAVVFVPQIGKARVSGAARWLSPQQALIQLSLGYKTDDHLWFSFFHEAGHLLLHQDQAMFLEEEGQTKDAKEAEANRFAADVLIPPEQLAQFLKERRGGISKQAITDFAHQIGIAPGIIVGRLQHDSHLPRSHCNGLKRKFKWGE